MRRAGTTSRQCVKMGKFAGVECLLQIEVLLSFHLLGRFHCSLFCVLYIINAYVCLLLYTMRIFSFVMAYRQDNLVLLTDTPNEIRFVEQLE